MDAVGARPFSLFMLAMAIYSLGYSFELNAIDIETAIVWSKFQYFGILSFPICYLLFVLQYTGNADWLNRRSVFLLFMPGLGLFLVKLFDNQLHWIYESAQLVQINSNLLLQFERGPLYPYVSVYQMFTVTLATMILIQKRRTSSEIYRKQTGSMLAAASVVYIVYFLYFLDVPIHPSLQGIDVNILAFALLAIGVSISIFRHGFLELVPIARDALVEKLYDGVLVLDKQGRIVDANPRAREIFAWHHPPFGKLAVDEGLPWLSPEFLENMDSSTQKEMELNHNDAPRHFEVNLSLIIGEQKTKLGYLALIHDITKQKQVEKMLSELSLSDELTGLYNRRGLNVLSEQLLSMADRMGMNAVLFYCDIDGLKSINDSQGHAVGDRAIRDAANLLRDCFRSSDIVARIGGDEFVLLGLESSENSASMMLDRLETSFAEHPKLHRSFTLSISTGMARYSPDSSKSLDDLLVEADEAMYKVKQAKKAAR